MAVVVDGGGLCPLPEPAKGSGPNGGPLAAGMGSELGKEGECSAVASGWEEGVWVVDVTWWWLAGGVCSRPDLYSLLISQFIMGSFLYIHSCLCFLSLMSHSSSIFCVSSRLFLLLCVLQSHLSSSCLFLFLLPSPPPLVSSFSLVLFALPFQSSSFLFFCIILSIT